MTDERDGRDSDEVYDAIEDALEAATPAASDRESDDLDGESGVDGTFLVTAADEDSAVLTDVDSGQVFTLSSNPGVEEDDAVTGRLAPEPPLEVTYELVEVESRRSLTVERSEEPPTADSQSIAADQDVGSLTRRERAGDGEIHVITVPPEATVEAVEDVAGERRTVLERAARLGVDRVEIRSTEGVVAVRYMP